MRTTNRMFWGQNHHLWVGQLIFFFILFSEDNCDKKTNIFLFDLCPIVYRYTQAGGKIYTYDFTHRSSLNSWPKWMGVTHTSEIAFVFGIPQNPALGFTEEEVNLSRRMMKHWANFARTGSAWTLTEAAQDCSAQSQLFFCVFPPGIQALKNLSGRHSLLKKRSTSRLTPALQKLRPTLELRSVTSGATSSPKSWMSQVKCHLYLLNHMWHALHTLLTKYID